ncbi:uncharacterized protein LOC124114620 isoform X2 [Haliotis rufescens]|uniref:uncharacterized protein LOC124114620 isoform X2 n=1 Tax=Haliotis rufescens TaxID=6454 RepID=UPI001EAFC61A|nr:uncharacterized protein LOC124114620 isoform X2 [Haliotis rufescens]
MTKRESGNQSSALHASRPNNGTSLILKAWCGHMSRMMYCTKEQSSANIPNQPTPTKTEDAVDPAPDISSYKVKEYYSHNDFSFYDIDADMKTHRLKQPSSHGALQP